MPNRPRATDLLAAIMKAAVPIRTQFRKPQSRILKEDGSPVTDVDMAVHESLLAWSKEQGLGYVGEEGNGDTDKEYILYVDPLDGTSSFSAGIPTVTVAASIMKRYEFDYYSPLLSAIYEPLTEWFWTTHRYGAPWVVNNHERVLQFVDTKAEQQLITSICPPGPLRHLRSVRDAINAKQPTLKHQACGSLALCGGLIASGMTHGLIFAGGSAAETAAMIPIVRGAGGMATDLDGEHLYRFALGHHKGKVDFILPNGAIFSNGPALHRTLVELVAAQQP